MRSVTIATALAAEAMRVTLSIGAACVPGDGTSFSELLDSARLARLRLDPSEADQHAGLELCELLAAIKNPKVIGIGETGLDYFYDHSDRAVQRALFRMHIAAARETGLPLIIHTRDAEVDTAAILAEEMAAGAFPALIHCFTASADFAQTVLELGLTISLSGIVTFKNAKDIQQIAADLPLERLLVETDAPFLAPVPHRGQTCEPAFVKDTCAFVAGLRGMTSEALAEATGRNFAQLFSKAGL